MWQTQDLLEVLAHAVSQDSTAAFLPKTQCAYLALCMHYACCHAMQNQQMVPETPLGLKTIQRCESQCVYPCEQSFLLLQKCNSLITKNHKLKNVSCHSLLWIV